MCCRVTASDHRDVNDLFNPPPQDESLKDSDLKDSDLKVMKLIDEMMSELRSNKASNIDETMISELSTQLCRRLDSLDVSDSPTMRNWKERTIKLINELDREDDSEVTQVESETDQGELIRWHLRLGYMSFNKIKVLSAMGTLPKHLIQSKTTKCTS